MTFLEQFAELKFSERNPNNNVHCLIEIGERQTKNNTHFLMMEIIL